MFTNQLLVTRHYCRGCRFNTKVFRSPASVYVFSNRISFPSASSLCLNYWNWWAKPTGTKQWSQVSQLPPTLSLLGMSCRVPRLSLLPHHITSTVLLFAQQNMDDDLSPDHCRTSGQSDCELKAITTWGLSLDRCPTLEGDCRNWANEERVGTLSPSAFAKSHKEGCQRTVNKSVTQKKETRKDFSTRQRFVNHYRGDNH